MVRVPPEAEPDVEEWSGCDTMADGMTATPLEWSTCASCTVYRIKDAEDWGCGSSVMWLGGSRARARLERLEGGWLCVGVLTINL